MSNVDLFGELLADKRKNFSRCNTGKRRAGDFYQTPKSMTEQFLDLFPVEHFPVLEPAAGMGAISNILKERYPSEYIASYDIMDGSDFFDECLKFPTIITNPPFTYSLEFIRKAMTIATERISFLMPIDYLHGIERYENIFSVKGNFNLKYVDVYVRRAMMNGEVRKDGKYETGMITWAWYSWIKGYQGDPMIRWINNDKYVLRKN